jgi:hypothetical protein
MRRRMLDHQAKSISIFNFHIVPSYKTAHIMD